MANYINGYDNPRFLVKLTPDGNLIETIDLDKLIYEGLIEEYEDNDIVHTTATGIIHKIPRKTRIKFTLNYADYILKNNLLKVQRLIKYEKEGKAIFLIPNKDRLARVYEVVFSGDTFQIGRWMGTDKSPANRLPVFSWLTKYLVEPDWVDPDEEALKWTPTGEGIDNIL